MSGNSFIDVAIGLVLMYLVLSVICTAVNEALATALNWRAKTLSAGIKALVDDPKVHSLLFDHGILAGPSAVAETPSTAGIVARFLRWAREPGPSYIDPKNFAAALLDCLDPDKPITGVAEVKQAAQHLQAASNIRDVLLTITTRAGDDITKARDDVAHWFDSAMDRLSGVYKRKLALWGFVVATALTLVINADSVTVARALWLDPGLRDQIAAMAKHAAESPQPPKDTPIGDLAEKAQKNLRDLESVRAFPLGWSDGTGRPDKDWYRSFAGWSMKIVGLLLTAFALTLGAPFWFDALSTFVRLRGSGEPPAPPAKPPAQVHVNVPAS
jgi:hypothetical protein